MSRAEPWAIEPGPVPEDRPTGLIAAGCVFAVILPIVGFILGIVAVTRKNKWASKHGVSIIVLSVAIGIAGCAVAVLSFESSVKQTQRQLIQELKTNEERIKQEATAAEQKAKQEATAAEQKALEESNPQKEPRVTCENYNPGPGFSEKTRKALAAPCK